MECASWPCPPCAFLAPGTPPACVHDEESGLGPAVGHPSLPTTSWSSAVDRCGNAASGMLPCGGKVCVGEESNQCPLSCLAGQLPVNAEDGFGEACLLPAQAVSQAIARSLHGVLE